MDQNIVLDRTNTLPPQWRADQVMLPAWTNSLPPRHLHVVPSLSLGGAERIVADLAHAYSTMGLEVDVAVMHNSDSEHRLEAPGVNVHRLGHLTWPERTAYVAGLAMASRLPAFCHLTSETELRNLWAMGVRTVPVVHNSRDGWRQDPMTWEASPFVPFVVACGSEVARDLLDAGMSKPVRVMRHVVGEPAYMAPFCRDEIRKAFGASESTLVVGMIGRFATQKRYTRAVRILSILRTAGTDARLVLIGAASGEEGVRCLTAALDEAVRLGVRDAIVLTGPIKDASRLLGAFDAFLNTSLWEGVSISTMEAVAAGIPVVSADVGGQREAVGPDDVLMDAEADDLEWADAIKWTSSRGRGVSRHARNAFNAAAASWPWTLAFGPSGQLPGRDKKCDVLFVTGNMDVGGAQRSLCNLVAELAARGVKPVVAVAGAVGVPGFMTAALDAGVEFIDVSGKAGSKGGLRGRVGRILSLALSLRPETLCFWNMDAATKMAVAKSMHGGPIRLADVSPGPMLYEELDAEAALANILSTSPDAYVASLDLLVSKYRDGGPAPGRAMPGRLAIIPNGVPSPSREPDAWLDPLPGPPIGADPNLAVITVGRLTAAKRPELLPLVALELGRLVPGATLTVVGGTHGTDRDGAWAGMMQRCDGVLPDNLHFVGPDDRTTAFLSRFACFYMVSLSQGCPNASLEAMACGLPVVANPDGGTAEQVEDGVNGRLVADPGDDEAFALMLAEAIAGILLDPAARAAMASASRAVARERFSMDAMASAYVRELLPTHVSGEHS